MKSLYSWKTLLIVIAIIIAGISIFQVNKIVLTLENEEKNRMDLHINALKVIIEENNISDNYSSNAGFVLASKLITENRNIPIIVTDNNNKLLTYNNLDSNKVNRSPIYIEEKIQEFEKQHGVITLDSGYGINYYYYGDSEILFKLRFYPYLLFIIILIFIGVIIIAFINAERNIQNQLWVGMSKETAHQMGTPLTSVVAWMELLKENEANQPYIEEMEKDVERLQLVADRFSKIGSIPQLTDENVVTRLQKMVAYMQLRSPINVNIELKYNDPEAVILLVGPLFDWVIENLIRNALDAMEGKGNIIINLNNQPRMLTIDVCDTGKGIPKSSFKKIFQPGYSTKLRGWGLGLSLAKRIIEEYHTGNIFVRQSEIGKGTTFRIIFRR